MKHAAGLVTILALGAAALAAQTPNDQTPTFRAGVELVRLDVQITDDNGRPIGAIRQDEIEVRENGTRRPVLFFQHVREPRESYVEAARHTIASEVSTNQGAPRGRLYVLVFDQDHITPGVEQKARIAAERFLRTHVRPEDRVAIYGLPGPGPNIGFTSDAPLASTELRKVRGGLNRVAMSGLGSMAIDEAYEISRGNDMALQRVADGHSRALGSEELLTDVPRPGLSDGVTELRRLVREDADRIVAQEDSRTRWFLSSLADLMGRLRLIEGRKTIVLFSEGFFTDHVSHELEKVSAAAARSYSVIYAVELNNRSIDATRTYEGRGSEQGIEIQSRLAPLASLALATDGRLVNAGATRLDQSLDRIASASQDYYLVGFAPTEDDRRDRDAYHPIEIRVSRPGSHVSTRTGFALAPAPTPADWRRTINVALMAPYPEQALPIEYTTYELRGSSPDRTRVVLSLSAELPLASPAGRQADVVFVARSARDGRVMASGTDKMPLPTSVRSGATTGTSTYQVQFDASPGDCLMRVVVREPGGLIGSADRRFSVRPLGGPGVSAGDLILGARRTGYLPAKMRLAPSEVLNGSVRLYARTPGQLEDAAVTFTLAPLGGSSSAIAVEGTRAAIETPEAGPRREVSFDLPLSDLAPGAYVVTARVRAAGEPVARVDREVEIAVPGGSAAPRAASAAASGGAPDPAAAIEGEVARGYLEGMRNRSGDGSPLAHAAGLALEGRWTEAGRAAADLPSMAGSGAWHGLRGLTRMSQHDFTAATDELRTVIRLESDNAAAAFLLGWADMGAGRVAQAVTDWREAISRDATLVPAYLALADGYVTLGQPALAAQALRTGLQSVPGSPELQTRLSALESSESGKSPDRRSSKPGNRPIRHSREHGDPPDRHARESGNPER